MIEALIQAFSGPGAGFMYAITAVMALGLAISVERIWLFWVRWTMDEDAVLEHLGGKNLDAALSLTEGHPVGGLIRAGQAASSAEDSWDRMGAKAALVESMIRRRVPYMATVGNTATMLGLLGTVYGLILAFSALGDASAVERAARLSEGIATAMATTAWGLLVGIPALAVHAILEGKAGRLLSVCEAAASLVAAARRSQS